MPQIDGSYLDRLFADFQEQSIEPEKPSPPPVIDSENESPLAEISPTGSPSPPVSTSVVNEQRVASPKQAITSLPSTAGNSSHPTKAASPISQAIPPASIKPHVVEKAPVIAERSGVQIAPSLAADDEELLQKIVRTSRLAAGELNVLRVMLRLCRERGSDTCYIKIPQLMADAALSDRQTQRILKNLRALELIEKLADYSNMDRFGTLYRLNFQ